MTAATKAVFTLKVTCDFCGKRKKGMVYANTARVCETCLEEHLFILHSMKASDIKVPKTLEELG